MVSQAPLQARLQSLRSCLQLTQRMDRTALKLLFRRLQDLPPREAHEPPHLPLPIAAILEADEELTDMQRRLAEANRRLHADERMVADVRRYVMPRLRLQQRLLRGMGGL